MERQWQRDQDAAGWVLENSRILYEDESPEGCQDGAAGQSNEQSDYQERRDASLSSRERGASLSERVASSEMDSTNPVSPGPPPRHILASEHTSTSGDNKIVGLFSLKSPGQQRTIHQNSNIIDGPPSAFRTPILEREPRTPARNI